MITEADILMGRDAKYPLTPELRDNLARLVEALNNLLQVYGSVPKLSSGYRPGEFNVAAGGAKKSPHLTCEAVDLFDNEGTLDAWCTANQDVLARFGLWQEDPLHTPGWCHLDIRTRYPRPPGRPSRTFTP